MENELERLKIVSCVHMDSLDDLRLLLRRNGWRIFEMDGERIEDKRTLLAKAAEQLPHETGMPPASNWDAWLDTTWGGLAQLGDDRVAFLWTHAEKMLEHGLPDLLVAADCFRHLAFEVATTEHGLPRPMTLRFFLVGVGDNFRPLEGDLHKL